MPANGRRDLARRLSRADKPIIKEQFGALKKKRKKQKF